SGRACIGRATENDVVLDDPQVSRHHAELRVGSEVSVLDLGSANGTRVLRRGRGKVDLEESTLSIGAGQSVSDVPVPLQPGDEVQIGSTLLVVEPAEQARLSLATRLRPLDDRKRTPSSRTDRHRAALVVQDPEMRRLWRLVERLADSTLCVL